MTVVLVAAERYVGRYTGLSSDTKPTTGVVAGATFVETDTGYRWVYDGSAWSLTFGAEAGR
jgi:hypothetical protein